MRRSFIGPERDITTEVELQRQLQQAQRLETVGRLAGGIAHDVNDLLTVVLNGAASAKGSQGEELDESLDLIEQAAERGAGVVRKLLQFSRREPSPTEPIDLVATLRGAKLLFDAALACSPFRPAPRTSESSSPQRPQRSSTATTP